ncbi:polysaccharide lyase family 8 super-sandwich domain-containing protein [uncultured Formosa sp.]|uniref:polysaccharide lyase family 8 super-sandwich domain-containing protein n=1 Tax=uncultured Formosa sp. TaxID=255435 RepID=UPI00263190CB|nr:polysaccharide lyase family 8 super-sandwich domain-containing protein [uncultured Formosa sp.]
MKKAWLILGLFCVLLPWQFIGQTEQLKTNFKQFYALEDVNVAETESLLNSLQVDGSWTDIDYTMTRRSNWLPLNHLKRLKSLAIAYNQPDSDYFQDKIVSEAILKGLNYWCNHKFWSENWWLKQIGIPQNLGPILILCESFIPDALQQKALQLMDASEIGMSGQNKIWLSGNVFMRELLRDHEDVYKIAATTIEDIVVQSTGAEEGLQPDFSFHQHGPQPQFGNYGLHFSEDIVMWMFIFNNTTLSFPKSKVDLMRNFLFKGQQKVVYNGKYDVLASGRQLFPEYVDGEIYRGAKTKYATFNKVKNQFNAFDTHTNPEQAPIGYTHFQNSDYSVYRTTQFFSPVRMSSTRIIGAEAGNGENQQAYYLGDGTNLIYRTGDEYYEIYPVWDWKKLPGTTIVQDTVKLPILGWEGYRNDSDFSGGLDAGNTGITAFKYRRDDVAANKSYVFRNNKIYALGSGITSSRNDELYTSINQCRLKGDVIVSSTTEGLKKVWHDSIAYFSLDHNVIQYKQDIALGSWNKVVSWMPDTVVKDSIFYVGIGHGVQPKSERYAYVSIVGVSPEDMFQTQVKDLATILMHTDSAHVLVFNNGQEITISAFEACTIWLSNEQSVAFNSACLVTFTKQDQGWLVHVSDPTQLLSEILFVISGEYTSSSQTTFKKNSNTEVRVKLPQGIDIGTTVNFSLEK